MVLVVLFDHRLYMLTKANINYFNSSDAFWDSNQISMLFCNIKTPKQGEICPRCMDLAKSFS